MWNLHFHFLCKRQTKAFLYSDCRHSGFPRRYKYTKTKLTDKLMTPSAPEARSVFPPDDSHMFTLNRCLSPSPWQPLGIIAREVRVYTFKCVNVDGWRNVCVKWQQIAMTCHGFRLLKQIGISLYRCMFFFIMPIFIFLLLRIAIKQRIAQHDTFTT